MEFRIGGKRIFEIRRSEPEPLYKCLLCNGKYAQNYMLKHLEIYHNVANKFTRGLLAREYCKEDLT